MDLTRDIGILTSISWNSNFWKDEPTEDDIKKSAYGNVKENGLMFESLNFGHLLYPKEEDGFYIGQSPLFNKELDAKRKGNVKIVFLASTNNNEGKRYIVGFYAFPQIGDFKRTQSHPLYTKFLSGNFKSLVSDIVFLGNYILINDEIGEVNNYVPKGKMLPRQSFAYLNLENVVAIIDEAINLNPTIVRIEEIKAGILDYKSI